MRPRTPADVRPAGMAGAPKGRTAGERCIVARERRLRRPAAAWRAGVALLGAHAAAGLALAAGTGAPRSGDLTELSLEELLDVTVTSVAKRETSLSRSPAAVAVITQGEIRRSGLTSIPELLRMVPGVSVASISANEWAISARGFNAQYASKLLVLVDGRSVYTPTFAGVYWSDQDLVLEDVDRIEIIRGPGATLWGANAVNGVINIISKSARETQGTLGSVLYGTDERPSTSLRYGGRVGESLHYRAWAKHVDQDGYVTAGGLEAPDDETASRGGFRLDWDPSDRGSLTLQGEYHDGDRQQAWRDTSLTAPYTREVELLNADRGGHLLASWSGRFSERSSWRLQAYYDGFRHVDAGTVERRHTVDVEWLHRLAAGGRHDLTWGLGYRVSRDYLPSIFYLSYDPQRRTDALSNAFLQDEIALVPSRLALTLGTKLEHNDYTGLELQPGAQLLWTPTDHQSFWASLARATRTPARFEEHTRMNIDVIPPDPPTVIAFVGNERLESERVVAHEVGYRIEAGRSLSLDLAGFFNRYENLIDFPEEPGFVETEPAPDHFVIPLVGSNGVEGDTYGGELAAQWRATPRWSLRASYARLYMHLRPDTAYVTAGDSPRHQAVLTSYLDLPHGLEIDGAAYFVDELPHQGAGSYVRLDLGVVLHATPHLEIGVWGQNLQDSRHPEFTSYNTSVRTEVPRVVVGRITWRP